MKIKLQFMKLIVKINRKRLQKRLARFSIKGEKFMVPRTNAAPVMVYLHRPPFGAVVVATLDLNAVLVSNLYRGGSVLEPLAARAGVVFDIAVVFTICTLRSNLG